MPGPDNADEGTGSSASSVAAFRSGTPPAVRRGCGAPLFHSTAVSAA